MAKIIMNHIKQTNPYNCGAACLAMVLDKDIDYISNILGRTCEEVDCNGDFLGLYGCEISLQLFEHGIKHMVVYPDEVFMKQAKYYKLRKSNSIKSPSLQYIIDWLLDGKGAILGVESNYGHGHWVVVDGGLLYDPKRDAKIKFPDDHEQLKVYEAILYER